MKTLAATTILLIGFTLAIPVILATGDSTATYGGCGQIGVILDTIRTLESGGNYTARAAGATASGAYQYIDSTWTHWAERAGIDTDEYPTADTAPPAIQDRVAATNVQAILDEHDGTVDIVPIIWYYPPALGNPTLMDSVPQPDAGNTLTVREYQTRWLATYADKTTSSPDHTKCSAVVDGRWALPVPIDTLDPATLDDPHHDYPAWDYMTPVNTPIFAITDGSVVTIQRWNGNWWAAGCHTSNPPDGCNTCGNGITIDTSDGLRHTYCHNTRLHVSHGETVVPGQHIADSGNSGRSGAPHLHLQLRRNGVDICPQPLLLQIFAAVNDAHRLPTAHAPNSHPPAEDCFF